MAKPGYGKRSAPDQQERTPRDFALLPTRERYVAGFIDHLPEGAAMSVKELAKQLPLYGQQAISTSLTRLSVAGHLRRVRCPLGMGDETRWVFRTFWSRTARDNEWWNAYLATEQAALATAPMAKTPALDTAPPPRPPAEEAPPPPAPETPLTEAPCPEQAPEPTAVPHQRTPAGSPFDEAAPRAPDAQTAGPHTSPAGPSPAYLALARLGRDDHRLILSADDCTTLEPQAAQWLDRGVDTDHLTHALTAGLPAQVDNPRAFLHHRLTHKIPPRLTTDHAQPPAPTRRILMECTDCGRPGPPEALPDGLCHPCRTTHTADPENTPHPADIADIRAHMSNLRSLLKPV
ncbi:MarR family transcriptional regulator [Streptomyces griseus]|uniref:MarR family transcriptional regulator n=1 Tax=Streptomyces griseus TaxID=1911 RepID=UPI00365B73AD